MTEMLPTTVASSESDGNAKNGGNDSNNVEIDAEDVKTDVKISNVDDTENKNPSFDPGFDRGRAWPLIDPADEEEDETDDGENVVGEENERLDDKASIDTQRHEKNSTNNGIDPLLKKKDRQKDRQKKDSIISEVDTLSKKNNAKDQRQKKDSINDGVDKNTKDQRQSSTEKVEAFPSCIPTVRNVKGLKCITISTVSSHPAGSSVAVLIVFFFCYCACRMGRDHGGGGKHWRRRMRNNRRRKRDNDAQGEYAALAVYDELLESFDDEELSSLYQSHDDEDDSDSSMSTILSEWSGKKPDIEMTTLENDLDRFAGEDNGKLSGLL